MLQETLFSTLDYSACAVIALAIFTAVFLAVGTRTMLASRSETDRCAALPLSDDVETPRDV